MFAKFLLSINKLIWFIIKDIRMILNLEIFQLVDFKDGVTSRVRAALFEPSSQ